MPSEREFAPGVSEKALRAAVVKSGYPLQVIAVDAVLNALPKPSVSGGTIRSDTRVQEEWSFLDPDEGKVRTLDALIMHDMTPDGLADEGSHPFVPAGCIDHHLDFLIECKHSELPFVFFLRDVSCGRIPRLVGLPFDRLVMESHTPEGESFNFEMSVYDALELWELRNHEKVPTAIAMRRALWKKSEGLELSGEEVFRELTYPISKAYLHYRSLLEAKRARYPMALYHHVHNVCLLVILGAPMVGITTVGDNVELAELSQVRLVKTEPGAGDPEGYSTVLTIDVVNIRSVEDYVRRTHATAAQTVNRLNQHAVPVLTGEARIEFTRDSEAPSGDSGPEFRKVEATISDADFLDGWRSRFDEVHSRTGDQNGDRSANSE